MSENSFSMYSFILKNVILLIYICVEHMYIEYYSTTKNEILPLTTKQMDLDGIMLDEISQSEK